MVGRKRAWVQQPDRQTDKQTNRRRKECKGSDWVTGQRETRSTRDQQGEKRRGGLVVRRGRRVEREGGGWCKEEIDELTGPGGWQASFCTRSRFCWPVPLWGLGMLPGAFPPPMDCIHSGFRALDPALSSSTATPRPPGDRTSPWPWHCQSQAPPNQGPRSGQPLDGSGGPHLGSTARQAGVESRNTHTARCANGREWAPPPIALGQIEVGVPMVLSCRRSVASTHSHWTSVTD